MIFVGDVLFKLPEVLIDRRQGVIRHGRLQFGSIGVGDSRHAIDRSFESMFFSKRVFFSRNRFSRLLSNCLTPGYLLAELSVVTERADVLSGLKSPNVLRSWNAGENLGRCVMRKS